jgi:hypothetical protein
VCAALLTNGWSAHAFDLVSVDPAVNGVCVPKTRFCNIGGEVRRGQAVM